MRRRAIATIWTAAIVVAAVASPMYMVGHGLCDTTTCGSNWLRPFLIEVAGAAVIGTLLVYLVAGRRTSRGGGS